MLSLVTYKIYIYNSLTKEINEKRKERSKINKQIHTRIRFTEH